MIIACGRSWLYSKVFNFWGTCRLPSFSTRHLQAPENNLFLLFISAAYRRTRKKHANVPATYLRWRSRSIRSTSVCSSCSTQSRKMEQNESVLLPTCHDSRPRAYARPRIVFDGCGTVSVPQQHEVEQLTASPPIAIHERMDVLEHRMEADARAQRENKGTGRNAP